jgi:hypothetical protein
MLRCSLMERAFCRLALWLASPLSADHRWGIFYRQAVAHPPQHAARCLSARPSLLNPLFQPSGRRGSVRGLDVTGDVLRGRSTPTRIDWGWLLSLWRRPHAVSRMCVTVAVRIHRSSAVPVLECRVCASPVPFALRSPSFRMQSVSRISGPTNFRAAGLANSAKAQPVVLLRPKRHALRFALAPNHRMMKRPRQNWHRVW